MGELIADEFIKYRRVIASLLKKLRPSASTEDIEDILQDTFINTYQSSKKQEIRFPKAFMVKTALRLANRKLAVARRMESTDDIEDYCEQILSKYMASGETSKTEEVTMRRQEFAFLCEAVSKLPEQCRRVFVLKKIYGLTQREIAQKLSISQSTVEKHVAKGLSLTVERYTNLLSTKKSQTRSTPNYWGKLGKKLSVETY